LSSGGEPELEDELGLLSLELLELNAELLLELELLDDDEDDEGGPEDEEDEDDGPGLDDELETAELEEPEDADEDEDDDMTVLLKSAAGRPAGNNRVNGVSGGGGLRPAALGRRGF